MRSNYSLLLVPLSVLAACGSGADSARCTENARCPSGATIQMCVDGEPGSCQEAWLKLGSATYACGSCLSCQEALQSAFAACASTPTDGLPTSEAGAEMAAPRVSVSTLRNPAAVGRPAFGARVTVEGAIVTAVKSLGNSHGFYLQDPTTSSWGGVYVHVGSAAVDVMPGAVVRASGTFTSFRGLEEISVLQGGSYSQTGTAPLPTPIVVTPSEINDTRARASELQSMLLQVRSVCAGSATKGTDFAITSSMAPQSALLVTSFVANDVGPSPFPAVPGQCFSSITGLVYTTGPEGGPFTPKLAPRSASDLQGN